MHRRVEPRIPEELWRLGSSMDVCTRGSTAPRLRRPAWETTWALSTPCACRPNLGRCLRVSV
eukprot:5334314-Alexandrium_andersonii.AAC.1